MPSPFPGMDPWLESTSLLPDVHATLIGALREQLVPQLRPRYFAAVESRVYVLDEDDPGRRLVVPDVAVTSPGAPGGRTRQAHPTRGGVAVTPATAVVTTIASEYPVREGRIVIRSADGHDVVTVVELLSPANKLPGSRGHQESLSKRREVLRSSAHLVEIDLLRAGARLPSIEGLPPGDYYVHVSRVEERPRGDLWAWTVREAAPRLPVPLRAGDADAVLDLRAAIHLAYERGGYDVAIDYAKPPEPPLGPEDSAWAKGLASV